MEETMTVVQPTEETALSGADTETYTPQTQTQSPAEEVTPEPAPPAAQAADYVALEAADMEALKKEFPELADLCSLTELEHPARYGTLRELGLSPKEAYLATEHRRAKDIDNRSHLRSTIPHAVGGSGECISASELAAARELFLGLSDHEIRKLYKKVTA